MVLNANSASYDMTFKFQKANNVVMQLLRANQNMLDEGRAWIGW